MVGLKLHKRAGIPKNRRELERKLTDLLGALIGEKVVAHFCLEPSKFKLQRPWFFLRSESGLQFSLSLEELFEQASNAQYFGFLAHVVEVLCTRTELNERLARLSMFERYSTALPLHEYRIAVYTVAPEIGHIGDVYYSELADVDADCRDGGIAAEEISMQEHIMCGRCECTLQIRLPRYTPLANSASNFSSARAILNSSFTFNSAGFEAELRCTGAVLQFYISERAPMNEPEINDERDLLLTVSIGDLELSLADLCALRPGMTLECAKPEPLEVVVAIDSAAIAAALLEFSESGILLKITKLLYLPERKSKLATKQFLQNCDYLHLQCQKRLEE